MTIASPFIAQATATDVVAGHDLSGKTVLVADASSGLGIETTRALLSAHAEVILSVCVLAKGEHAAQQLRETTTNQEAHVLEVDLGLLASIRQAASQFLARWATLHVLVNNAGVMAPPQGVTLDGFGLQLRMNYLGHYLLTCLLLPALLAAAPPRVVVLSSSAHHRSDIHFEDRQYQNCPYDKWKAYGQSKTANALFAVGLTQYFGDRGITANAVNLGGTLTELQQHLLSTDLLALGWIDQEDQDTSHF
ncbi:hypothetical protein KSC_101110 [Ktedonobacter sp. SOSP1-52]|uniref:SDR family NAD(P)-dependent oxidoreductase n=1 Tax=Ktedonobacter sp. SOSP1-52 TaxID=2778366 RepID=UPI0019167A5E|nr:SDR family NAD(P)-dependent oxidoreductase [Ktedonobacter sp. SOSP1-52]GHO71219.1 hypothetical protein KSC_101110 [Ktedonobacter sp. SOSP1-52]